MNRSFVKSPCYECRTRQIGCHGSCQAYTSFRAKKDAAIQQRNAENDVTGFLIDQVEKNVRRNYISRRK